MNSNWCDYSRPCPHLYLSARAVSIPIGAITVTSNRLGESSRISFQFQLVRLQSSCLCSYCKHLRSFNSNWCDYSTCTCGKLSIRKSFNSNWCDYSKKYMAKEGPPPRFQFQLVRLQSLSVLHQYYIQTRFQFQLVRLQSE